MQSNPLRELVGATGSRASYEVFSQYTVGRMLRILFDLLAEWKLSGRLALAWDESAYPLLPPFPGRGDLGEVELRRLSPPEAGQLFLSLACGEERFAMAARLVENPGQSVFQQRLPVELAWGFSAPLCEQVLEMLGERQREIPKEPRAEALSAEFSKRFIKYLESHLLESRHSLSLITGILRVQKAISSELDFDRLLELTGEIMRETFGFAFGEIELLEEDGELHHKKSWTGPDEARDQAEIRILLEQEQQMELFKAGAPVFVSDVMQSPLVLNQRLIRVLGLRTAILLPLHTATEGVGLLKLFYSSQLHLGTERLGWLEELSALLANAILNAREHTRVFELATKDGLTNIHNRRYFEEQYDLEVQRQKRGSGALCLLMLDVDHFKNYNDQNGHLAGDQVLIRVAKLIKGTIRSVDFLARYGGEEFIILLSGASLVQGWRVAEKIRTRIAKEVFEHGDKQPGGCLTVSIGCAAQDEQIQRLEDLIKRADKALYFAKDNGRNQVAVFEDPEVTRDPS